MREGNTSRVMAADRPYCEFYDFYSVSPAYFGFTLVAAKHGKKIKNPALDRKQLETGEH
jgi:hypothetical protein